MQCVKKNGQRLGKWLPIAVRRPEKPAITGGLMVIDIDPIE